MAWEHCDYLYLYTTMEEATTECHRNDCVLWYFWYNFKYKDGPLTGHRTTVRQSHKNVLSVHLNCPIYLLEFWLEYDSSD